MFFNIYNYFLINTINLINRMEKFFLFDKLNGVAICQIENNDKSKCAEKISRNKVSNKLRHIQRKHNEIYKKYLEEKESYKGNFINFLKSIKY